MYNRVEASKLKHSFWTAFGRYMALEPNSEGLKINWVNYHTGFRSVYFRMEAGVDKTTVSIDLAHTDETMRALFFERLEQMRSLLHDALNEEWEWQASTIDASGKNMARISKELKGVSVYNQEHCPQLFLF